MRKRNEGKHELGRKGSSKIKVKRDECSRKRERNETRSRRKGIDK